MSVLAFIARGSKWCLVVVCAGNSPITLTKVKHRRELLFASLPALFAIHQFIEGFVWLGLDGVLSPTVTHDMGAAFMLYAQGLLPFLLRISVLLFEPNTASRKRIRPFTSVWCAYAAVASVIILAYFWRSKGSRPFRYSAAI